MDLASHTCTCTEKCVETSIRVFSVYGAKTNYVLENNCKRKITKYIVDDCLLKTYSENEKCDYLFKCEESECKKIILVELKGSDIFKAIKQIDSTYNLLASNFTDKEVLGRIIPTKVPTPYISDRRYKKLFIKLKSNLIIRNSKFEEQLN